MIKFDFVLLGIIGCRQEQMQRFLRSLHIRMQFVMQLISLALLIVSVPTRVNNNTYWTSHAHRIHSQ